MLAAQGIKWVKDGKKILKGIDINLNSGECLGLIGPNGSGKSSLLKILSFLESPTAGQISFQGSMISGRAPIDVRRKIAVVFQEALLLNTTVFENVAVGLKIRGKSKEEINEKAESWLHQFGILHLKKQKARTLSGGEAQRASLARAFALEPDIMFLDEPFSALDTPTREALLDDLTKIFAETKIGIMLVSHDFNDIRRLSQQVAVLVDGTIEAKGTPEEILKNRQQDSVEAFIRHWKKV